MTLNALIESLTALRDLHPEFASEPVKVYWWRGQPSTLHRHIETVCASVGELDCVLEVSTEDIE